MLSNWTLQNANQMPSAATRGFLGCVSPLHLLSELRATAIPAVEPYAGIGAKPGFTGDPRQVRRNAPQGSI
jgi:hypothetical protein